MAVTECSTLIASNRCGRWTRHATERRLAAPLEIVAGAGAAGCCSIAPQRASGQRVL